MVRGLGTDGRGTLVEPVAIVGMSCVFPGEGEGPEPFWRALMRGETVFTPVPPSRWDSDRYYAATPRTRGKTQMRQGGFLPEVEAFDAAFFGISPLEARHMDPQHRLALQLVWSALEDANIRPSTLKGSDTGVFLGLGSADYFQRFVQDEVEALESFTGVGNAPGAAAGRIAHILGLHGPCMVIDTTCSSGLTNLHAACLSLRAGECDLALAGAVQLMLSPRLPVIGSQAAMLSPTDRCHTFDARADGFVRGEGGGVVTLKLLAKALADGDLIHALVLGSAVNHDGASFGLTVPNGPAQQRVIEKAFRVAGVSVDDIGYVEAHGTGTPLGDPIEVNALSRVFQDRAEQRPLLIGSVKTNIGHLEAASGMAGLLKTVLCVREGIVPPAAGLETLSPKIDWTKTPVRPAKALSIWPQDGRRVAGVSSFGFSGTNVHAVLAEPPPREASPSPSPSPSPSRLLLPLSARTGTSLAAMARAYAAHLDEATIEHAARLCRTATHGRDRFACRAAVTARSASELRGRLVAVADALADRASSDVERAGAPRIGFVFGGQGSAYVGMAAGLVAEPAFHAMLERLSALAEPELGVDLASLIAERDPILLENRLAQPTLYIIARALCALWAAYDVRPHAVLGHSLGELAAAATAGMISDESAVAFVVRRGLATARLCAAGAMVEVLTPDPAATLDLARARGLAVAADNGPDRLTLAGAPGEVEGFIADCGRGGLAAFRLSVDRAFHSPLCDPAMDEVRAAACGLVPGQPSARFISSLLGTELVDAGALVPDYWCDQFRRPVAFAAGLRALREAGCDVLIDIGPHPALRGAVSAVLGEGIPYLASLGRGRDDADSFAAARARLFELGAEPFSASEASRRDLGRAPVYAFDKRRHWHAWTDAAATPPMSSGLMTLDWEAAPAAAPSTSAAPVTVWAADARAAREWADHLNGLGCDARAFSDDDPAALVDIGPGRVMVAFDGPAAARPGGASEDALIQVQRIVRAAKALAHARADGVEWVVVTRGATSAGPQQAQDPGQAAVWSAVRSFRAEGGGAGPRLIDLPPGVLQPATLRLLVEELGAATAEVALRDKRMIPRLRLSPTSPPRVLAGGRYVVTGATGGLGMKVVDWLIAQGAAAIAINARDLLGLERLAARIRAAGLASCVVAGDLAQPSIARALVAAASADGAIAGVFHCAGTLADATLANLNQVDLATAFATKGGGLETLLDAIGSTASAFFVGFSSLAAVLGSPGQAAYAAANGFMDAMLINARLSGRQAVTVNWGPWEEVGMGARLSAGERLRLERGGMAFLSPREALDRLARALTQDSSQVVAAAVDWPRYVRLAAEAGMLGLAVEGVDVQAAPSVGRLSTGLALAVGEADGARLAAAVQDYFEAVLREISHMQPDDPVPVSAYLGEIGFDSLMLLTLKGRLEADLDLTVPLTVLGGPRSIGEIVDHAVEHLGLRRLKAAEAHLEDVAVI